MGDRETALARSPEMSALGKSESEIKKFRVPDPVFEIHDARRRKAQMSWPQYARHLFTINAIGLEEAKKIEGLRLDLVAGIGPQSGDRKPESKA